MQLSRNSQFEIHKNEEISDSMSRVFFHFLRDSCELWELFFHPLACLARWQNKKKSKREAPSNLIVVQLLIWIQAAREEKKVNKMPNRITFHSRFCLLFYSNSESGKTPIIYFIHELLADCMSGVEKKVRRSFLIHFRRDSRCLWWVLVFVWLFPEQRSSGSWPTVVKFVINLDWLLRLVGWLGVGTAACTGSEVYLKFERRGFWERKVFLTYSWFAWVGNKIKFLEEMNIIPDRNYFKNWKFCAFSRVELNTLKMGAF